MIFSTASFAKNNLINNAHAVYKLENYNITDFLIEFVKMNVLERKNTKYIGEVFLSLAPIGKEKYFDCKKFYSSIGKKKADLVKKKMSQYLFLCEDGSFSEKEALEKFKNILQPSITEFYEVDATWAWFSATGNKNALKRFITNYLYNDKTCQKCIEWSYSSNSKKNEDVYNYLKYYSTTVEIEDQFKLFNLGHRTK